MSITLYSRLTISIFEHILIGYNSFVDIFVAVYSKYSTHAINMFLS